MTEIRVVNLKRRYGPRQVLDIPTLTFPAGCITAVVGPSGAGKSTLLRLLNLLERPTSGQIYFDGRPIPPNPSIEDRRRVTTVFQRPVLLRRSVAANLAYGLRLHGRRVDRDLIDGWLAKIGLLGQRSQAAHRLSAGEMQRVALARALLIEPEILLLDEPTANLDPANVALLERLIKEDHAARQTTVVIVTHNLFQARRLGEQLLFLQNGRVVEMGETERLFTRPEKEETRGFLRGEMVY